MKDLKLDNHLTGGHLTDEVFAACLDGTPLRTEAQAHLGACEQCRIEMERFQVSMTEFSGAASTWSRAQPVPSLRAVMLSKRKHSVAIGLQWALAAALLVGVGVPVVVHTEHHKTATAETAADDSDSQIAQDNAMLTSVNMVLATRDPSPFQQYDLTPGPQKSRASHAASRAQ